MSWLFDAQTTPNVTTSSTTNSQFPDWYQKFVNANLAKASSVIDEPYTPYTGPRNAPTNADQTAAYNLTRQGVGAYQPMIDQGASLIGQSGQGFNQGQFDSYMNPYISQVNDRVAALGARNLSENLLPQVNDSFIRANQFGSTRNGDFTERALRDTQESILGQQSANLASGFNTALGATQAENQAKLAAGQGLGSLAQTGQTVGLKDAAALQSIGAEQQGQTQKNLDTAHSDFQQQQNYPKSQAEWMSAIIRGINPPTSSTTTSTAPATSGQLAPNPLSQVAGAGVGIGSLLGLFAKGGRVKRPAPPSRGIGAYRMAA
jgi:hypothetical protein